jgi:hypothetical protein
MALDIRSKKNTIMQFDFRVMEKREARLSEEGTITIEVG